MFVVSFEREVTVYICSRNRNGTRRRVKIPVREGAREKVLCRHQGLISHLLFGFRRHNAPVDGLATRESGSLTRYWNFSESSGKHAVFSA